MAEQESNETIAQLRLGDYAVPSLAGVRGSVMFEGARGHVHMRIDDGKVTLSRTSGASDLVLRTEIPGELLRLVRGEANAVTSLLRGRVEAEGDLMLLMKVAGSVPDIGLQQEPSSTPSQPGAE